MNATKNWLKLFFLCTISLTSSLSIWSKNNAEVEDDRRDCVETKHLQVLINTADPTYRFVLFNGVSFVYNNIFAPRPFGSYYHLSGLIYPGDTVDINQPNYTVSKRGVPLTAANSLGDFWASGDILFPELTLPNVPATPTDLELFECDFLFKPRGNSNPNNVFTYGILTSGVLDTVPPLQPLLTNAAAVQGGTGLNTDASGEVRANVYFQPATLSLLVDIFFDCPVKYNARDGHFCEEK
jgi:hypothetical protein